MSASEEPEPNRAEDDLPKQTSPNLIDLTEDEVRPAESKPLPAIVTDVETTGKAVQDLSLKDQAVPSLLDDIGKSEGITPFLNQSTNTPAITFEEPGQLKSSTAGKEDDAEIQSIIEQFEPQPENETAIESGAASPVTPRGKLPPRSSSLASVRTFASQSRNSVYSIDGDSRRSPGDLTRKRGGSTDEGHHGRRVTVSETGRFKVEEEDEDGLTSPTSSRSMNKALPPVPTPEPEPDKPFDFHRFLEQLRHKSADPVAGYLRSFLVEFGKKQWMVHEQVKIISDFLAFISVRMSQAEIWKDLSEGEFDNAREGMEKLVMNRLYTQTFSPAIPLPASLPGAKNRRKTDTHGPGRRGQHQEDVELDDLLTQKITIYSWIKEAHLDFPEIEKGASQYIEKAKQELLKINNFRAPRDKVICILNSTKLIALYLKNSKSDTSADSFMPLLIYLILKTNPANLVSNTQYIFRFRNRDKLGGEAGYYLSSLMGAIQFIEGLDRTSLTITDEEFDAEVEKAVSRIAEERAKQESLSVPEQTPVMNRSPTERLFAGKGGPSTPATPGETMSEKQEERMPLSAGLFKTIQRPLAGLGRMFSEDTMQSDATTSSRTPQKEVSPAPPEKDVPSPAVRGQSHERDQMREVERQQARDYRNVVETLTGMFPNLDRAVIKDIVVGMEGRIGPAVDSCLALSAS